LVVIIPVAVAVAPAALAKMLSINLLQDMQKQVTAALVYLVLSAVLTHITAVEEVDLFKLVLLRQDKAASAVVDAEAAHLLLRKEAKTDFLILVEAVEQADILPLTVQVMLVVAAQELLLLDI
jgi:hypothetical protein